MRGSCRACRGRRAVAEASKERTSMLARRPRERQLQFGWNGQLIAVETLDRGPRHTDNPSSQRVGFFERNPKRNGVLRTLERSESSEDTPQQGTRHDGPD